MKNAYKNSWIGLKKGKNIQNFLFHKINEIKFIKLLII